MKKALGRSWLALLVALIIASMVFPSFASAASRVHVVKRGENLTRIAVRYGTSVSAIMKTNGIRNRNYIYVGQRLRIPGSSGGGTSRGSGGGGSVHVVKRGQTLAGIARLYGRSVAAFVSANGLRNPNRIYVGQRLRIPGKGGGGNNKKVVKKPKPSGGKWIDIDLSSQTVRAMRGGTVVRRMRTSTGIARYPTPVGSYRIYAKYRAVRMRGCCPKYDLPGVPWTMFFYRGFALHGTYWHNNFGTPMSHGCVNLRTSDAGWLYRWAPNGTLVKIHR
jgi:lipoprotein-anchoring transpeptidase ErfK/SrfK